MVKTGLIAFFLIVSVGLISAQDKKTIVVSDFEDSSAKVVTYNGPKSQVSYSYQKETVHAGKSALKVTKKTSDWSGALLELDKSVGDWTGYKTLTLWVFGAKTGGTFNVDLEDKDSEQFRASFTDDFSGWKELTIDLEKIAQRSDYQAPTAKPNKKIDFPLKTIQFFTASSFNGTLIFDDISVSK